MTSVPELAEDERLREVSVPGERKPLYVFPKKGIFSEASWSYDYSACKLEYRNLSKEQIWEVQSAHRKIPSFLEDYLKACTTVGLRWSSMPVEYSLFLHQRCKSLDPFFYWEGAYLADERWGHKLYSFVDCSIEGDVTPPYNRRFNLILSSTDLVPEKLKDALQRVIAGEK